MWPSGCLLTSLASCDLSIFSLLFCTVRSSANWNSVLTPPQDVDDFLSIPAFRPGLVQSGPAWAKMWMHHCWRSMDTDNLISASLRDCCSVGLWKVSGKKIVFTLNCVCCFFSPSLYCIYRGKPGQVFVLPPHHPNCLEVPEQARVRAALWPWTVPVRSSLHAHSQGPPPISSLGHIWGI